MNDNVADYSLKNLFSPLTSKKGVWIIIITGIIVFFNALFGQFVWDDVTYITSNPGVHSVDIVNLFGSSQFNSASRYRPIPATYFAILYGLFKTHPFFYHLIQISIHIVNTSLLFLVFERLFSKKVSLFLAIIFLVHPMQVESVSFVAASGNPLFFLFGISALLLSMQRALNPNKLLLITVLLLLSVFTKETGILFLIPIILFRLILVKKDFVKFCFMSLLIVLIYLFFRFAIGNADSPTTTFIPIAKLSLIERLFNVPAIVWYYLKTIVFPLKLTIDQQWVVKSVSFSLFYFPLIVDTFFITLVGVLGFLLKKHRREYIFFSLWFMAGLAFHLQIIPLSMTVADRWIYFPLAGLLGMIGVVLNEFKPPDKFLYKIGLTTGIIIILLLATRTIVRNINWHDGITLYTHDLKIYDNFELELILSNAYLEKKDYQQTIRHLEKSVDLFPNELNYNNLATIYEKLGKLKEAEVYYRKALTFTEYPPAGNKLVKSWVYHGLIWTLLLSDKYSEANEIVTAALKEYPKSGQFWSDLAISEYKLGHQKAALQDIEYAKSISNDENLNKIHLIILQNGPMILNP